MNVEVVTQLVDEMLDAHRVMGIYGQDSQQYHQALQLVDTVLSQHPNEAAVAQQEYDRAIENGGVRHTQTSPPPPQDWGGGAPPRQAEPVQDEPLAITYAKAFEHFMGSVMNCPVAIRWDLVRESHRVVTIPFSQDTGLGQMNPWMEKVMGNLKQIAKTYPDQHHLLEALTATMLKVPKAVATAVKPTVFHTTVTSEKLKQLLHVQGGFPFPLSIGFTEGWYLLEVSKRPDEIQIAHFIDYACKMHRDIPEDGLVTRIAVDTFGEPVDVDLSQEPHMMVLGMTGSGKDMVLKCMAWDLTTNYSPEQVKFVMVDHQGVGIGRFARTPWSWRGGSNIETFEEFEHLFIEIEIEIQERAKLFQKLEVEDIDEYNRVMRAMRTPVMPRIVVFVTEMTNFMETDRKAVGQLRRDRMVAQARKFGVHFVFSSQRPVGAVGKNIRSEFGNVLSLLLKNDSDSEELFGSKRAVELCKKGDALFLLPDMVDPTRVQTLFIDPETYKQVWKTLQSAQLCEQWATEMKPGTIFVNRSRYPEFLGEENEETD